MLRHILRESHRDEGQILVMGMLLLAVLLGMLGLIIDGGSFYQQRRQAQSAADSAALAAAGALRDGATASTAVAAAREYAANNGFNNEGSSNTVTVNIPPTSGEHAGSSGYAEVIISEKPRTFFIQVVLRAGTVGARGVAGLTPGGGSIPWAVDRPFDYGAQVELEFDFLRAGSGDGNSIPARIDKPGIGDCAQASDDPTGNQYCPGIYFGSHRSLCAVTAPGCTDYVIESEPGRGLGEFFPKTIQAVQRRFDNTDPACATWQQVQTNLVLNDACNPFRPGGNIASRRVVLLTMVQAICDQTQPACNMTIREFRPFFLDHYGLNGGCTPQKCLLEVDGYFLQGGDGINPSSLTGRTALVD